MIIPLHVSLCELNKTATFQQIKMEDHEMWQQKLDKQVSANFTVRLYLDLVIITYRQLYRQIPIL